MQRDVQHTVFTVQFGGVCHFYAASCVLSVSLNVCVCVFVYIYIYMYECAGDVCVCGMYEDNMKRDDLIIREMLKTLDCTRSYILYLREICEGVQAAPRGTSSSQSQNADIDVRELEEE